MKKTNYLLSFILLVIAIVFTILVSKVDVKTVEVKPIDGVTQNGALTTDIGFSSLNQSIADKIGFNNTFYKISKYAGYLALVFVAFYGFTGLIELMQKKSLKGVNKALYMLAAFYVCVAIVYVLFEVVVINNRPVDMGEGLEASFPSSHTMLALCVCGSSLIASKYIIKKDNFRKCLNLISWVVMLLVVCTRTLSGVHWITDIFGGILISVFMLNVFSNAVKCLDKAEKEEKVEQ
ncbi:MAG: phosphatase PAP2 family protein [Clostridia bacterium]|nr:phosphatase PAP2 family protein [Clostridia bacterium]